LCEKVGGEALAGSDVTAVAWASEDSLAEYSLTPTASRVVRKAFARRGRELVEEHVLGEREVDLVMKEALFIADDEMAKPVGLGGAAD
jgi:hypothetical protein